jgi:hypothetical protein
MTTTQDPPHIARAKALLTQALEQRRNTEPIGPTGVVTVSQIIAAENALAAAQQELREYQYGDSHMHETVDASGRTGIAVSELRAAMLDHKREAVSKRRSELAAITRAWIAQTGLIKELEGQIHAKAE